jgi:hypothetical protein
MVQQAVDKWNSQVTSQPVNPSSYAYARQVFDDRVIISMGEKTLSVPYTVTDGVVKFSGEPTEVRQAWVALSTKPAEKETPKVAEKEDRIRSEGGKYTVYGSGNLRLAAHLTRDAAEQHLEAIDKILGA